LKLYHENKSPHEIGKIINRSRAFVRRLLIKNNIKLRENGWFSNQKTSQIIELYNQGLGSPTIAKQLGCSATHVTNILKRNNIEIRKFDDTNVDEVIRLYQSGHSLKKIAKRYCCGSDTIKRRLIDNGIVVREPLRYGKDLEDKIINLYNLHKSVSIVAKLLNITCKRVYYILNKYNQIIEDDPLKIDEITQLLDDGKSIKDLCLIFNKKDWQIRHFLKINNIKLKDIKYKKLESKIIDAYKRGYNTVKVASIFHCSPVTVAGILKSNGIEIKKNGKLVDIIDVDFDLLINKYKEEYSSTEIGQLLGLTRHQVVSVLKHFNVPRRKNKWLSETGRIIDMYNNNLDMIEISRRIGCSDVTVARILKNNNVCIRPYAGNNVYNWRNNRIVDRKLIDNYYRYKDWTKNCYKMFDYESVVSQTDCDIHCHHIYGMRFILKSSLTKHSFLPDDLQRIGVSNDNRFYDLNNGLILTAEEHCKIENVSRDAHYYWRIWKHYSDFALSHFPFSIEQYNLFDDKGMIDPQNSDIMSVNSKFPEVKKILRYEHYIGTIPAHKLILVGHKHNVITGIAVFGRGGNKNLPQNYWELLRLCVPYYIIRPFTIDFLNMCVQYIKNNYVNISKIIAYSDPNIGHDGAIYRMANWKKEGRTQPSYCYFDPSINQLKHKSYCRRIKGVDKTERQLMSDRGLIRIELSPLKKYSHNLKD